MIARGETGATSYSGPITYLVTPALRHCKADLRFDAIQTWRCLGIALRSPDTASF